MSTPNAAGVTLNCEKDPRWEAEFWKAKAAGYFQELNALHQKLDGSRADVCRRWKAGVLGNTIKGALAEFTKRWNPEYGVIFSGNRSKFNNGAQGSSPFNAELTYIVKLLVIYGKATEAARRSGGKPASQSLGVFAEELRALGVEGS